MSKSPKIFKSATLRKPSTEVVSTSKIRNLEKSEDRGKKIQDLLKTKILHLKQSFEVKKNKQLEKLVQLEGDREKKNKILIEKLNRISSFQEKVSKSYENPQKKSKIFKNTEAESDEDIKKYFEKLDRKFSQAKKRSQQDIHTKVLKAQKLSRNRSICKRDLEEEENEFKLEKLIKKVERMNEIKKVVEKNKRFRVHLTKLKDENKKKDVVARIFNNQLEVRKKLKETEKKLNKNLDWVLEEKLEKMKTKAVQNEIEQLSAKTRIDRLHTKFVNLIRTCISQDFFQSTSLKQRGFKSLSSSEVCLVLKNCIFYLGNIILMKEILNNLDN